MADEFIGEFEHMDLSDLEENTFMVAISNGPREKWGFLCTSLIGPFDFYGMVEKVANMYKTEQLHAKAMICSTEMNKAPQILDPNTIDYIEAQSDQILTNAFIGGLLDLDKEFTCKAGFNKAEDVV